MCGIAGYEGPEAPDLVAGMLSKVPWRGPDGQGCRDFAGGALGHLRLSIIDPAGGAQPLANEDESLWLALNGEIYNYRNLRERVLDHHQFRTGSDGEVILHLFEQEGPALLDRLLGMYALAIRGRQGQLLLARDPLGIKPLYWGRDGDRRLLYASEIKALLPYTADVHEFPPGAFYLSGHGLRRFRGWSARKPGLGAGSDAQWRAPAGSQIGGRPPRVQDPDAATALIHRVLNAAVGRCLVSDVPVGVFLSGGLDSSLIAALAQRRHGPGLKSFAVGLTGSPDLAHARVAAAHIGTEHYEYAYSPDEVAAVLPQVIYHLESYDPPLVRSAVATWFASRLAARHVKVVLTGEGADELFAGYHYLKTFSDWRAMHRECLRITAALHNTNLQRADRQSMAHSLEARVPFLELPVVRAAFAIHPALKLGPEGGTEKWLLRKVAAAYLPEDLVWRRKEKFSLGTGTGQCLAELAETMVSEAAWRRARPLWGEHLHSKEEYLYWQYFHPMYGVPQVVRHMGRARTLGDLDPNPGGGLAQSVG